jgi:hypothetical protein
VAGANADCEVLTLAGLNMGSPWRVAGCPQEIRLKTVTWATHEHGARFARVGSVVEHDQLRTGRLAHRRNPYGRLGPEIPWEGAWLFLLIVLARTGGICKRFLANADRVIRHSWQGDIRALSAWFGGAWGWRGSAPYERARPVVTSGVAGSMVGIHGQVGQCLRCVILLSLNGAPKLWGFRSL